MNTKFNTIFYSVVLFLAIFLIFFGREQYYFISTIFLIMSGIFIFLFVLWIILGTKKESDIYKYKNSLFFRVIKKTLISSGILLLATIFTYFLIDYDTSMAKKYCESLIGKLEKYKEKHETYPLNIEQIESRKLPARLSKLLFYESDGYKFKFVIMLPGPNGRGAIFKSDDQLWKEKDFIFTDDNGN